jgi:hypothetical protein
LIDRSYRSAVSVGRKVGVEPGALLGWLAG